MAEIHRASRAPRHSAKACSPNYFLDYLSRRWAEGCVRGRELLYEIKLRGYTGSFSSKNVAAFVKGVRVAGSAVVEERKPVDAGNPFLFAEKLRAASISNAFDFFRDWRDAVYEQTFLSIYGSPAMIRLGEPFAFERTRKDPKELRFLPEVQAILLGAERGGFEEAVIRMLILIAEARNSVRRDRLERAAKVLSQDEPFASLGLERRAALIHEQSVIVEFEPDLAVKALPQLPPNIEERRRAIEVVEYIAGAIEEMESSTIRMVQRFNSVLGLPPVALSGPGEDPLPAARRTS